MRQTPSPPYPHSSTSFFHPAQAPLTDLRCDLESLLSILRSQLVKCMNEDYGDYLALSAKLGPVDAAVARMKRPVMTIRVGGTPVHCQHELYVAVCHVLLEVATRPSRLLQTAG